ncbi:hypothetical protein FRC12_000991 [Ceratobasidium sp. 428]|nr:hypothetical protein FRC12_000991 [Ceratobasidium sp. 428]
MCAKSVADSPAAPTVDIATLSRELEHIGSAKALNVAAVTFLFWDILLTLQDEVNLAKYPCVYQRLSLLSTGKIYLEASMEPSGEITQSMSVIAELIHAGPLVLFHPSISPNRWGISLTNLRSPSPYDPSRVVVVMLFIENVGFLRNDGSVNFHLVLKTPDASVVLLLLRVWIMWDRSTRMLVFLLIVFGLFQLVPVVLLGSSAEDMHAVPNPLPGILTGCVVPFTAQFQWVKLLLCHLLYESTLFILTVLQVWRSSRQGMVTPVLGYIVCE